MFGFTLYLILCMAMAVSQRSFIYYPSVFTSAQVDQMAQSAKLERWTNLSGQFVGLKRLSPIQPADGVVLIAYGNGGTAIGSSHYADDIQKIARFDVFILEYPGYEDRPGLPSQKNLFNAAGEAFQMLSTNKPVYLGRRCAGEIWPPSLQQLCRDEKALGISKWRALPDNETSVRILE